MFSVLLLLIFASLEREKIYAGYIKLLKKTTIVKQYNNKGQLNGEIIGYIDGNIDVSTNFVNGLRDGLTTEYYKNGQVENQSFFRHNKREGEEVEYYENGKLNYKRTWKNNKGYGSIYHYTNDSKIVNYDGLDIVNLFFYMEYDATGKTTKAFGHCFSSNIFSYDLNGDSTIILSNNKAYQNIADLNITIATPPNLIPQINLLINDKPIPDIKIKDNTINVKDAFFDKGIYNIKITGDLMNKNRRIVRADTLNLTITKN